VTAPTPRALRASAASMRENAARLDAAGKHYAAAACRALAERSERRLAAAKERAV
jgi:hypothetical protein